ncbi:hypothetical protein TNCV_3533781 [Trichonephila clavipes]|nr:hypothetical protein TNCV_3533781 [Trichonephila clavipes]
MQQRSLNSSLEATAGSPLVHLVGMLLNGSTSSLPNSPLQPSVTSITYGPWYTTFATSLILDGPILPCTTSSRFDAEVIAVITANENIPENNEGVFVGDTIQTPKISHRPRLHGRKLPAICRNESALYLFTRRPGKMPARNAGLFFVPSFD